MVHSLKEAAGNYQDLVEYEQFWCLLQISKIDIMGKKKRKRINVRKLNPEDRKRNAQKWLTQPQPRPKDLLAAYATFINMKRFC
jgi:hypothetical protein